MLFCGSMVQPSCNGLVGGRSLSSLKQMFHKDSTVSNGLQQSGIQQPGLPAAIRPSISGPMTMLGVALTFGASVPLLSTHEPVLAADGLGTSATSTTLGNSEGADSSRSVAYYTVESGDSLWQIAEHHDADIKVLEIVNSISPDEVLRVGQVLKVPPSISSTDASPSASGGVGGEFTPLSLANPSLTLRSTQELRDDWKTSNPSLNASLTHASQGEVGSEAFLAQANPSPSASKSSLAAAETLVSFSSTGSLVPVTYVEQAPASPETTWVDASSQSVVAPQKGPNQVALTYSEVEASSHSQEAQLSSEEELNRVAAANTYDVNREQVIRESLARMREANTVTIDRDQLASKLALARQQLERSRSQEINQLTASADGSTLTTSSPSAVPAQSDLSDTDSVANHWVVDDVSDPSSATVSLAKSASATAVAVDPSTSAIEAEASNQHVLAAAPLNPDIYRPLPTAPTGQTVVPGMPMLPGAGEFLPQAPADANGYVWPTRGTFTSGYGWRWGRMHRGIDIAGPVGTPIVAAASGVVVRSGWNSGGYGNVVDIRHRDGSMTRYAHNSRLLVREGQQVNQGQSIAQMGSTGYSTGPHLHFEIHLPGNGTVNPIAYLPQR